MKSKFKRSVKRDGIAAVLAVGMLLLGATFSQAQAAEKPNVLFVLFDDLNDWIGAMGGHSQAITPNIDRLMKRGVYFANAHCAAPVCAASRHALMSGLRPSTTGWYGNSKSIERTYRKTLGDIVPLPVHFKNSGYKTMAAGKVFHSGVNDVDDYAMWDESRPKHKWSKRLAARGNGYSGSKGGHFYPFPPDGGAVWLKHQKDISGLSLCWGALEEDDIPEEGMPDEQVAAWAVERLKVEHDRPFMMAVGFVRPHLPLTAPKAFFDLYADIKIDPPIVPADEMSDIPLIGKAMAYGTLPEGDHGFVLGEGPEFWREMTVAYLACVSFADAQLGKLLDALDGGPHADNTVVVLWSDHGQNLGEKNHWRKMCLWEESTRVPLAFSVPGLAAAGRTSMRAVSLMDVYPTLIEVCGLKPMEGLEGVSLMPLLQNPDKPWNHPAVTTWYYGNHSVRSDRYRYIRYRDGTEELYDHQSDPGEHVNLAGEGSMQRVIGEHRRWLPVENKPPAGDETFEGDSLDGKIERLRTEGVPGWLR